ncbi:DNA polymerase III subunits gamma and tau [Candidatus Terasakiella magnetica]|uniref:DNA polymerase III subunit gamma/tau n=1 Tax=Candidatus Terasakiella magnetica TaxID=1867952 RepID=A0A1C3REA6_9PROT|nr:DNA polymerase III subunit gamma/tau [Candidatus Terasakiella magnetica]SCA55630.1 DNA polymerase III subunits gamma and tau [Candidatus Terasakiella magnetica]
MTETEDNGAYRVLARKYRPSTFEELIGQDAMVRTLSNAIESGRLAQAFMLTGVRGVGKTTTARLVARALNCVGEDGQGSETITPCGVCDQCTAIAQDRHVDVIEMDAASRTGVDDIREVIESVRYRPTSARYKIYIIDEVHMLSKGAFNALLKTLEEPPEHVKFIFATTEIRKVPVTVLSRCQRFDLRRIDQELLASHFNKVAEKEDAKVDESALAMIARAADGSVRDGLSLLDQAIAHCHGEVGEAQVRDMLGLADRGRTFDLFDAIMKGDAAAALEVMDTLYAAGADPSVVLQDLLELTHWLTRVKVVPDAAQNAVVSEMERVRGKEMSDTLAMSVLARAYQILMKGLGEVRNAPHPQQAAEMVIIRLCYVADMPTPEEAVRMIQNNPPAPTGGGGGGVPTGGGSGGGSQMAQAVGAPNMGAGGPPNPGPQANMRVVNGGRTVCQPKVQDETKADPQDFPAVVALSEEKRNIILKANLMNNLHLVSFEPGKIEFRPGDHAPSTLAGDLKKFLDTHTSRIWAVSVSRHASGDITLAQVRDEAIAKRKAELAKHPLVSDILSSFPGSVIEKVHEIKLDSMDAAIQIEENPGDPDHSDNGEE